MAGDGKLKIKNVLISVSDKRSLKELVTCLDQNEVSIFSDMADSDCPVIDQFFIFVASSPKGIEFWVFSYSFGWHGGCFG